MKFNSSLEKFSLICFLLALTVYSKTVLSKERLDDFLKEKSKIEKAMNQQKLSNYLTRLMMKNDNKLDNEMLFIDNDDFRFGNDDINYSSMQVHDDDSEFKARVFALKWSRSNAAEKGLKPYHVKEGDEKIKGWKSFHVLMMGTNDNYILKKICFPEKEGENFGIVLDFAKKCQDKIKKIQDYKLQDAEVNSESHLGDAHKEIESSNEDNFISKESVPNSKTLLSSNKVSDGSSKMLLGKLKGSKQPTEKDKVKVEKTLNENEAENKRLLEQIVKSETNSENIPKLQKKKAKQAEKKPLKKKAKQVEEKLLKKKAKQVEKELQIPTQKKENSIEEEKASTEIKDLFINNDKKKSSPEPKLTDLILNKNDKKDISKQNKNDEKLKALLSTSLRLDSGKKEEKTKPFKLISKKKSKGHKLIKMIKEIKNSHADSLDRMEKLHKENQTILKKLKKFIKTEKKLVKSHNIEASNEKQIDRELEKLFEPEHFDVPPPQNPNLLSKIPQQKTSLIDTNLMSQIPNQNASLRNSGITIPKPRNDGTPTIIQPTSNMNYPYNNLFQSGSNIQNQYQHLQSPIYQQAQQTYYPQQMQMYNNLNNNNLMNRQQLGIPVQNSNYQTANLQNNAAMRTFEQSYFNLPQNSQQMPQNKQYKFINSEQVNRIQNPLKSNFSQNEEEPDLLDNHLANADLNQLNIISEKEDKEFSSIDDDLPPDSINKTREEKL